MSNSVADDDPHRPTVTDPARESTKARERRRLAEALRANLRRRNARRRDSADGDESRSDLDGSEETGAQEKLGG